MPGKIFLFEDVHTDSIGHCLEGPADADLHGLDTEFRKALRVAGKRYSEAKFRRWLCEERGFTEREWEYA